MCGAAWSGLNGVPVRMRGNSPPCCGAKPILASSSFNDVESYRTVVPHRKRPPSSTPYGKWAWALQIRRGSEIDAACGQLRPQRSEGSGHWRSGPGRVENELAARYGERVRRRRLLSLECLPSERQFPPPRDTEQTKAEQIFSHGLKHG
jgi:hypothetical protein